MEENPFSPFSAMSCHSHKIQAPPGRLKKTKSSLFHASVLGGSAGLAQYRPGGHCRCYPECVLVCAHMLGYVCVWPCSPSSSLPSLFAPQTHADFMEACRICSPSPCPHTPASFSSSGTGCPYSFGVYGPKASVPSLLAGMPRPRGWWGHWGHGRQGRQVPCCCRSWLNIVPGQLGNTNRSGKEMKLLEQTRCAWQGSRLRDKVLPSTCQPARVIY